MTDQSKRRAGSNITECMLVPMLFVIGLDGDACRVACSVLHQQPVDDIVDFEHIGKQAFFEFLLLHSGLWAEANRRSLSCFVSSCSLRHTRHCPTHTSRSK